MIGYLEDAEKNERFASAQNHQYSSHGKVQYNIGRFTRRLILGDGKALGKEFTATTLC